jgi:hypothetical protein
MACFVTASFGQNQRIHIAKTCESESFEPMTANFLFKSKQVNQNFFSLLMSPDSKRAGGRLFSGLEFFWNCPSPFANRLAGIFLARASQKAVRLCGVSRPPRALRWPWRAASRRTRQITSESFRRKSKSFAAQYQNQNGRHGMNNKDRRRLTKFFTLEVVAGGGIEPPTQGFSVLCSTD